MRPAQATSPFTALAAALQPVLEPEMSETRRLQELAPLEAVLAQGQLPQVVDRALARTGGGQLLLVIDQFEELYALDPPSPGSSWTRSWPRPSRAAGPGR